MCDTENSAFKFSPEIYGIKYQDALALSFSLFPFYYFIVVSDFAIMKNVSTFLTEK